MRKYLILFTASILLTFSASSAPAFEVLSGELDLNDNPVQNVSYISVNSAITDGNVSDSITIGQSGTVDTAALKQEGASSGEALEWNGSSWSPATDQGGANQSLSVTNDSTGNDDLVSLDGGGGSFLLDDDYEADTVNAYQNLSTTNASNPAGLSNVAHDIKIDDGADATVKDYYEADTVRANQSLSVTNNSDGSNDAISISGGNSVMVQDDFEANTDASTKCGGGKYLAGNGTCSNDLFEADNLNANQTISATNDSSGNDDLVSLGGNGGSVLINDDYAADDQTLTLTNDSSGTDDKLSINNGNTVLLNDDFEADTVKDNQNLTSSNATNPASLNSVSHKIQIEGGDNAAFRDYYEQNTDNVNANQTVSVTNDSSGTDDLITLDGNGGSVLVNDDFEADTVKDNQNLSVNNASNPGSLSSTSHDLQIDGGTNVAFKDWYESNTDASTQCSGGKYLAGNGTCANDKDTNTDEKVSVDSSASAGYLGASSSAGVLSVYNTLNYSDETSSIRLGLSSSVAGNELSFSSGSLDVDEGSSSGLNADQLDGTELTNINWSDVDLKQGHVNSADVGLGSVENKDELDLDGTESMSGDVDVGGNNVTNADVMDLKDSTNAASGDTCNDAGAIRFNGTRHLGCDGSNWNAMY